MTDQAANPRPTAIEMWLVVVLFVSGFAIRAAWPSRLAVEHFDEGVYASNIFFLDDAVTAQYPDQHLYAPPLLPRLIEFTMILLGPSNVAAMAVNIAAGSVTIPLVWWVGRRWFGATAGLASATLVAMNDVHIFFSRTALTDVLLCFLLVAAVYFVHEALASGSRLALIAAGVATGLAWWTKYNGWLPLAIGLAGLVPWRLFVEVSQTTAGLVPRPGSRQNLKALIQSLGRWAAIALIAFLVWSPWLWSLQDKGGYSAVEKNHRGYLVGLSGWLDSLTQQSTKLGTLDGWLSLHAPLFAVVVCLIHHGCSTRRSTWNVLRENPRLVIGVVAAFGLGIVSNASIALAIAAALGIAWEIAFNFFPRPGSPEIRNPKSEIRNPLAGWLLAAWFTGLFLVTPLYTPYPRLTLPWLTACWLGAGLVTGKAIRPGRDLKDRSASDEPSAKRVFSPDASAGRRSWATAIVLAGCLACASFGPFVSRRVPGWEPRTGLAEVTPALLKAVRSTSPLTGFGDLDRFVIYTYGEPAALFQLRLAGVRWVRAVRDVDFADPQAPAPRLASFLVFGTRARGTPGFAAEVLDRKGRLQLVQRFSHEPSRLVLLDDSLDFEAPHEGLIELFEVK